MPTISLKNVAAGTANALDGLNFQSVPSPGALVSIAATTPTAGGTISYSVGTEQFLVKAQQNIESSADEVDMDRDQILNREPVPPGKQFLSCDTQIANLVVTIETLPG